jgi:hypothetical protein
MGGKSIEAMILVTEREGEEGDKHEAAADILTGVASLALSSRTVRHRLSDKVVGNSLVTDWPDGTPGLTPRAWFRPMAVRG